MDQFLLDVSVNIYESIAMMILMLTMFRFPIKDHIFHAVITALVMAQTSYLLRFILDLDMYTPFFMILWLVIFFWRLFRIHAYYVMLVIVSGYLGYLAIQSCLILLLQINFSIEEISQPLLHAKLFQIASSTITLLIAYMLWRKRIGFSFVPDRMEEKVEMNRLNISLLITSVVSFFMITGLVYFFIAVDPLIVIIGPICLFSAFFIINFSFKKEMRS